MAQHDINQYPSLRQAVLWMALCNDMINREYTEEQFIASLAHILGADGVYEADLRELDSYFSQMPTEDQNTVVDGEQTEAEAIMARFPRPELFGILNDIFEKGGL